MSERPAARIPKPAHPSPDRMRRKWLNLNGEWDFSYDEPLWNRQITVPFSWASPLSGIGEDRRGSAYYRKIVRYPLENNRLFLIFGAVDYACDVYVNGEPAGSHLGGYSRFECEITNFWQSNGENEIVVKATDDDLPYQTYGKQGYGNIRGIWQTVYLEERPSRYIDHFTITTRLDGTVTIMCSDAGEGDLLGFEADFEGAHAASANGNLVLLIEQPRLWTPETPYLYEGTLTLRGCQEGICFSDCIRTYFGIREVSTGRFAENGPVYITLNGKPLYINGTLDQSFNPQGYFTLPDDGEAETEILRMKRLGLNLARIHIKPEEPLKLYFADKLGLLIMADMPCFWGEPDEQARRLFEMQMIECMERDINHPAIIYWVIFNETWGLLSGRTREDGSQERVYAGETQEWVRACYRKAKQLDPTRLVEDNSPCRSDHVETDVNSWHFYTNGYWRVKQIISDFADGAFPGSTANFIGDNICGDIPAINSECGNVWGIKGSAGDSDLSWHYKYMLNEFRLHDRLGGFIFTEFHDVINEFNGYYRIDNSEKDFGYGGEVPGMGLADLHASDFLACDLPPMQTVGSGASLTVPLYISSFTDHHHNRDMQVRWELAFVDRTGIERIVSGGSRTVRYGTFGKSGLFDLPLVMPAQNGIATLRLYLLSGTGAIVMRNYVQFDVLADDRTVLSIEPARCTRDGFQRAWLVQQGSKLNAVGAGAVSIQVDRRSIPDLREDSSVDFYFEASARAMMTKDRLTAADPDQKGDVNYMLGYKVDRGANPNSFFMTDGMTEESAVAVYAEQIKLADIRLPDSPADCRGRLLWHYQIADDLLDEAGSYGYLCHVAIPNQVLRQLPESFMLTIRSERGFSLFGRKSGRYPTALDLQASDG